MRFSILVMLVGFGLSVGCGAGSKQQKSDYTISPAELLSGTEGEHPAVYFTKCVDYYKRDLKSEAFFAFYVGQIRYQYHLKVHSEADTAPQDAALLGTYNMSLAQPMRDFGRSDLDRAARIIEDALKWDAEHGNEFSPKSDDPEALGELRKILGENAEGLREYVKEKAE